MKSTGTPPSGELQWPDKMIGYLCGGPDMVAIVKCSIRMEYHHFQPYERFKDQISTLLKVAFRLNTLPIFPYDKGHGENGIFMPANVPMPEPARTSVVTIMTNKDQGKEVHHKLHVRNTLKDLLLNPSFSRNKHSL